MASNEPNKLLLLQQHVSGLKDQKNEVDRKKSELLQKKDIAISDVSEKCESLKKSINKSKTSAIQKLNDFYEEQQKLLDDALANLETRISRSEKELIIDLNGIPVPNVKSIAYDFDVTMAKTSIDQLRLRSLMSVQFPSTEAKGSTSKAAEANKKSSTTETRIATVNLPKLLNVPTPKKPRLSEGRGREHVRDYIKCNDCQKPRCLYRDHFITDEEKLALSKFKASALYFCGEQLPTGKCKVAKTLVVEDDVDCNSVISWHYFHPKLKNPLVCYLCGLNCVNPMSEMEKQEYRSLHKICTDCQIKGGKKRCVKKTSVEDSDDEATLEYKGFLRNLE